ncbi:MAG TPA: hypothetical protein VGF86_04045 [Candidatus Tumulicola sp.]|jgi:hypothetical protein
MTRLGLLAIGIGFSAVAFGGCGASTPSAQHAAGAMQARFGMRSLGLPDAIPTPALIGTMPNGSLAYFPITAKGGSKTQPIGKVPGMVSAEAMASNGDELTIVNQGPPAVYVYDLSTKKKKVLADPFGVPVDVAIDRKGNRYVLNFYGANVGNIAMYAAGASKPKELTCRYLADGQAIALDNEGDIFVNEYRGKFIGVVEIPNGAKGPQPQDCTELALKPESGYAVAIGVDPKTDDLIVVDDPNECAGKHDGRMTIYPKPYKSRTGHSVDLNGNCIIAFFRLDATSSTLFAFNQNGPVADIIQRSYPSGKALGSYENGGFSGMTTLPNTLPN